MARPTNQSTIEDYLKVLFTLGEWDSEGRSNAAVAARLSVSTSTASEMMRKLTDLGLVEHEPYRGIELTATGLVRALDMVRRHRLIETYLVQQLGYAWDEVHDEAEILEHAVSPLLMDRIDAVLSHPWRDPHGDPIPTADGVVHQPQAKPLAALESGEHGWVARIVDDDPLLLRWFSTWGVGLDVRLDVIEQQPFGGPLRVELAAPEQPVRTIDLGIQAVDALWLAQRPPIAADDLTGGCHYEACRHIVAAAAADRPTATPTRQ